MHDISDAEIERALTDALGNRQEAAFGLGISTRTLQRRMKAGRLIYRPPNGSHADAAEDFNDHFADVWDEATCIGLPGFAMEILHRKIWRAHDQAGAWGKQRRRQTVRHLTPEEVQLLIRNIEPPNAAGKKHQQT